jgi:hypothetical protein
MQEAMRTFPGQVGHLDAVQAVGCSRTQLLAYSAGAGGIWVGVVVVTMHLMKAARSGSRSRRHSTPRKHAAALV